MRAVILLFLFGLCLAQAKDLVGQSPKPDVGPNFDFHPNWSPVGLNPNQQRTVITIEGCGFKQHAEVVCLFDFEWTSVYSEIVDDNTIICEVPVLELTDFLTLPQWSRLDITFGRNNRIEDCSDAIYVGQFRWGPQLDFFALSREIGPSIGSSAISIFGEGFSDPVLSNLEVFFDGQLATGISSVSDTVITASPPDVDELGVDALVSVVWNSNPGNSTGLENRGPIECYLHSQRFYHYGPSFDRIEPSCAPLNSSATMTIIGSGFQDPLLSPSPVSPEGTSARSQAILEVQLDQNPPNWNDNSFFNNGAAPNLLQTIGTVTSDSTIVFQSPDFLAGYIPSSQINAATVLGNLWGAEATVTLLWRQTRRLTSSTGLTYSYGPTFDFFGTEDGDLIWHYGGGETLCVTGCGFLDEAVAEAIQNGELEISYDDGSNSVQNVWDVTNNPSTHTDDTVCYPAAVDPEGCSGSLDGSLTASWDSTSLFFRTGATVTFDLEYHIGPRFIHPSISTEFLPQQGSELNFLVTGENKAVIAGEALCENLACTAAWDTIEIDSTSNIGSSGTSTLIGTWDLQSPGGKAISIDSASDTQIVLSFTPGIAYFGEIISFDITFTEGLITCDTLYVTGLTNDWNVVYGPTCSIDASGPLTGGVSTVISGTGLSPYETVVKLCDSGAAQNNPTFNPSISRFIDGWSSVNPCWVNDTINSDPVGTVEIYSTTGGDNPSFTPGTLWTEDDAFRGRRNWGQTFDVVLMVNSAADLVFTTAFNNLLTYNDRWELTYDSCEDQTNTATTCTTGTFLQCGTYRFGPVTESFSPCQGPFGPSAEYITPVTFSGSDLNDDWADFYSPGPSRDINPHLVAFGDLLGQPITSPSANSIQTSTVWGAFNTQPFFNQSFENSVAVFFDTCNITLVPDFEVSWGPIFFECPLSTTDIPNSVGIHNNENGCKDLYGYVATGSDDQNLEVTITGLNFAEYFSPGSITCLIDGVETAPSSTISQSGSTESDIVVCPVPQRPFGTIAKVCLAFNDLAHETGFMLDQNSVWSTSDEQRSFDLVLCAENQFLIFSPRLYRDSNEDYIGHTSGFDTSDNQEDFTVICRGCQFYLITKPSSLVPSYFVGSYETSATISGDVITFDVPTFVAEFGEDASIAIQWVAPNDVYSDLFVTANATEDHWKIWADFTYHYGPVCDDLDFLSPLYGTTDEDFPVTTNDLIVFTITGQGFDDCHHIDNYCASNDTIIGGCLIPQPSQNGVLMRPFSEFGAGDSGNRGCLHRQIEVSMGSFSNLELDIDTFSSSDNDDGHIPFRLPNRTLNLDCASFPVTLTFVDALISSQFESRRTLSCGTVIYGPAPPTLSSYYAYTNENSVLGPTIYGWGLNRPNAGLAGDDDSIITATWTLDDYFFINGYIPTLFFGTVAANNISDVTNVASIDYRVPNGNQIGQEVSLSTAWVRGNSRLCTAPNVNFHYGPEILRSSRDNCEATGSPVCPANGGLVTIQGRAFGCCGYDRTSPSNTIRYQHRCAFSQNTQPWFTGTEIIPQSTSFLSGNQIESVVCNIPEDNLGASLVDRPRLVGFGLVYGVDSIDTTGTLCSGSGCNIGSLSSVNGLPGVNKFDNKAVDTIYGAERMQICYLPRPVFAEYHVRYSGYGPRTSAQYTSSLGTDSDMNFPVGVNPPSCSNVLTETVRFRGDDRDTFWVCHYNQNEEDTFPPTSAQSSCPSRLFAKTCGATDDTLSIEFLNITTPDIPSGASFVPGDYVVLGTETPGFYAENDVVETTVSYGPLAVTPDLTDIATGSSSDWTPSFNYLDNTLYSWVNPNLIGGSGISVTFHLEYADDWLAPFDADHPLSSPITKWGTQLATCFFGTLDNSIPSFIRSSTVVGDLPNWVPVPVSLDWQSQNDITVDCNVPTGHFGLTGSAYILLDPHTDFYTQHYLPDDPQNIDDTRVSFWHWTPYVSGSSSSWTAPDAVEVITYYGYGFSYYEYAVCSFGSDLALFGDIFSDTIVFCQTPPYFTAQSSAVSIVFANDNCVNSFCSGGDLNTVNAGQFFFSGVNDYHPRHGPVQGNTTIYFDSFGFEFYDSIDCVFEDGAVAPVFLDASSNSWACTTPLASRSPQNNVINIVGHYQNFLGSTIFAEELGCVAFDFGLPSISSFSSLSVVYGSSPQTITIRGDYFNGGADSSTFECRWQIGQNPSSDLPLELGATPTFSTNQTLTTTATRVPTTATRDGNVFQTFDVVCSTPASGFAQIGQYPFELVYAGLAIRDVYFFSVVNQAGVVSSTSSTNGFVYDYEPEYFNVIGSGFAGGRLASSTHSESYLCRFGSTASNPQIELIGVGSFVNDSAIQCISAPRNLTLDVDLYFDTNRNILNPTKNPNKCPTGENANQVNCLRRYCFGGDKVSSNPVCHPTFDIPVSVSIDGGYTWLPSTTLAYTQLDPSTLCGSSSSLFSSLVLSLGLLVLALFL